MDRHTIAISGKGGDDTVTADKILICTGGRPEVPDLPGREFAITSNEAFHLPALPKHVTIVGGGYIAVEFAGIFNGLGAKVDLVIRRDRVLRGFDEECRTFVHEALAKGGIKMRTETQIARITATPDGQGGGKAPFQVHTPLGGMFETDVGAMAAMAAVGASAALAGKAFLWSLGALGSDGPGHAIDLLIDPFEAGRVRYEDQAQELLDRAYGGKARLDPTHLRRAGKRDILVRMLNNLKGVYLTAGDHPRALSVVERMLLLRPEGAEEHRLRAARRGFSETRRAAPTQRPQARGLRERLASARDRPRHVARAAPDRDHARRQHRELFFDLGRSLPRDRGPSRRPPPRHYCRDAALTPRAHGHEAYPDARRPLHAPVRQLLHQQHQAEHRADCRHAGRAPRGHDTAAALPVRALALVCSQMSLLRLQLA